MVQDVRFPLLLLLGLFALLCPVWALPRGFTPFEWFQLQHVQPNPLQCNQAMIAVNQHLTACKPLNTFLHDSLQNVINVCTLPNMRCRNDDDNCHESVNLVNKTICQYTGKGTPPNCPYRQSSVVGKFTVACNPHQNGDRPGQPVPVHLD